MKIPQVKGTRDFYPAEMAVRNWIVDGWKRVSQRNGFEEYDGPIFERLEMFQIKSGDEIVDQLFSLQDRAGRNLAIRPEITPTLARMVNQQINSLPRPIKWFSVPRLCRAERPQKGRLREFFQWNIDIIGVDDPRADAEVIFATVDYLREIGLSPADVKVKMSSRRLLAAVLMRTGIGEGDLNRLYALLDKRGKLPAETFAELLAEQVPDTQMAGKIDEFMGLENVSEVGDMFGRDGEVGDAFDELAEVHHLLSEDMGVGDYCQFDPSIVRGLAYYTGVVFEVHARGGELRAICGGGRYDNLLSDFGGPATPATGMGMGDCVLEVLLREKGLLDEQLPGHKLDYFVACVDEVYRDAAFKLTMAVRSAGLSANFSYKATKLGKQLKTASDQNARKCVIIGDEFKDRNVVVKDMASGDQEAVGYDAFLAGLAGESE